MKTGKLKSLAVDDIRLAVSEQLNTPDNDPWVYEILIDPLEAIIRDGDQYFRVGITMDGEDPVLSDRSGWVEVEQIWVEKSIERRSAYIHAASRERMIFDGGAIKVLGDGRVGGHLVMFGGPNMLDLEGDFFTAETDFGLHEGKTTGVYLDHGLDPIIKNRRLGQGELKQDEVGIWIDAKLELRDQYEQAVYDLVEAGKLGWSSSTSPTLMEREKAKKGFFIKAWPLGIDASLTVIPAEPRIKAIPLKSYQGIDFRLSAEETRSRNDPGDKVEAELEKKKQAAIAAILGG